MASKTTFITVGSIIILILSAIAFIFVPAYSGGADQTQGIKPFGYYKKQPIEYKENSVFLSMLENTIVQRQQRGENVDDPSVYYSSLNEAFNATALRMFMADQVKESGYVVPNKAISRVMMQSFVDETGAYSPKLYNAASNADKIAMQESARDELTYQQYYYDLFGEINYSMPSSNTLFGLKTAKAEVPFIASMDAPKKAFDVVAFSIGAYPPEELKPYAEAHASLFEKLNCSVITVGTKAEAEKVLKRVKNSEITFEDAVAEYSNKNYSDASGNLRASYNYQVKGLVTSEDDFSALLQLNADQISGVIQTGSFFSIFKSNGASTKPDFNDLTVLENVYNYVTDNDIAIIEDYFMSKAQDFASQAAVNGFDQACEKFGVTKVTTDAFPLNYYNNPLLNSNPMDVDVLAGVGANENVLKTLFALKDGEVSSPVLFNYNVIVAKAVSTSTEETSADFLQMFYPYYTLTFDQSSASTVLNNTGLVKNDVLSVYLEEFLAR